MSRVTPLKEWPTEGNIVEFYDKFGNAVKRVYRLGDYMRAFDYAVSNRPFGYPYAPFKLWACTPQGPELKAYYE